MKFKASWLNRGYFDFRQEPVMPAVRDRLAIVAGRKISIESYPPGRVYKHTYFWRDGDENYSEAQYFMRIAEDHPVLSMGVSVEKGLEGKTAAPEKKMDRRTWDWQRLIDVAADTVTKDVPRVAAHLSAPVEIRTFSWKPSKRGKREYVRRAFVLSEGNWFERYVGRASTDAIVDHLRDLDQQRDVWAIVNFTCDFHPAEIEGLSPAAAADVLLHFRPIRDRLRARSKGARRSRRRIAR